MYTYVLGTFILRYRYNKEIVEHIYPRYAKCCKYIFSVLLHYLQMHIAISIISKCYFHVYLNVYI